MVEISWNHNECIRVLCLYPRDSIVDDVTRYCRRSTRRDVNNNGDDVRKLSLYIVRSKTDCQKFHILTASLLLHSDVTRAAPSIVHIQDQAPAFFLPTLEDTGIKWSGFLLLGLEVTGSSRTINFLLLLSHKYLFYSINTWISLLSH